MMRFSRVGFAAARCTGQLRTKATAAVDQSVELKKALKAAGPVSPYALFVAEACKNKASTFVAAAAKWKTMGDNDKAKYIAQANKNKAAHAKVREQFPGVKPAGKTDKKADKKADKPKRRASPYALFVKEHFPAAYAEALKGAKGDKKAAFSAATKAVSQKYKSQK